MKNFFSYQKNKKIVIIIILAILCLISLIWFILSIKELRRSGELRSNYNFKKHLTYLHNITNANNIMPWMTFDYINVIFRLDPVYLKNNLMINDPRYPNIRIDNYTKRLHLNTQIFLHYLQQAITNYTHSKQ